MPEKYKETWERFAGNMKTNHAVNTEQSGGVCENRICIKVDNAMVQMQGEHKYKQKLGNKTNESMLAL
jgi:hypothetical protein